MKTVVFDFDGVIHSYKSGWKGDAVIPDEPVKGIGDVIEQIRNLGYKIVVVSTRCITINGIDAVNRWLEAHDILVDDVCSEKPPAVCYVDDRAICFDGNTDGLVEKIKGFHSWTEKEQIKVNTGRLVSDFLETLPNCFDNKNECNSCEYKGVDNCELVKHMSALSKLGYKR